MNMLLGLQIVYSPVAREVRTWFTVERTAIKKRRRGWRVVKHHIDRPGCYRMGNTLVMHPDVYAAINKTIKEQP